MRKNRVITNIILTVICIAFLANFSYASSNEDVNGDLSLDEGANPYIMTPEDAHILNQKFKEMEKRDFSILYDPDAPFITLNVPVYQQETSYWCGPATVKQVVQFIKGSSESQSNYAKLLGTTTSGTDMTVIAEKLRTLTGKNYVYYSFTQKADWTDKLLWGLNNNMPAVLDIDTRNVSAFPYRSSGHFVNVSGMDLRHSDRVRITDPYGPGLGNRWYERTDLYNANRAHWRSAIIW